MSARSVTLLAIALAACGDDATSTPDTSTPIDTSAPSDTNSPADVLDEVSDALPDTTPDVLEGPVTERFRFAGPGLVGPLVEAQVRFFMPGGKTEYRVTSATGEVEIEVDYAQGPLGVAILGVPDRADSAALGFRRHDWDRVRAEDGTILLPSRPEDELEVPRADLYGVMTGYPTDANHFALSTDLSAISYEANEPTWRLEGIPLGHAGTFIAVARKVELQTGRAQHHQVLGWAAGKVDALDRDTELAVQFTNSFEINGVQGSFQAPPGDTDAFDQRFRMWAAVYGLTQTGLGFPLPVGTATSLDVDAMGVVSFQMEYVRPEFVTAYFSRFMVVDREVMSLIDVDGTPAAGTADFELYPIPIMGSHEPAPASSPIYWDTPPEDAIILLSYGDGVGEARKRILQLMLPAGTYGFDPQTRPELMAALGGHTQISALVAFCDYQLPRWSRDQGICVRISQGAVVPINPP